MFLTIFAAILFACLGIPLILFCMYALYNLGIRSLEVPIGFIADKLNEKPYKNMAYFMKAVFKEILKSVFSAQFLLLLIGCYFLVTYFGNVGEYISYALIVIYIGWGIID